MRQLMFGMQSRQRVRSLSLLVALLMTVSIMATAESSVAAADGSIAGRVTNELGAPIPFAKVEVITNPGPAGVVATTYTGVDGSYRFNGLATGYYWLHFDGPGGSPPAYVPEYWSNAGIYEDADSIHVDSVAVTGIDPVMVAASTISGRVTDLSGSPISGTDVVFHTIIDGGWSETGPEGVTDASGNYTVMLKPGIDYRVYFANPTLDFAPEFWPHGTSFAEGRNVTLTKGVHLTGIDGSLLRASHIKGVVLPENSPRWGGDGEGPYAQIALKRGATWRGEGNDAWRPLESRQVNDLGHYDFGELHAGTYRLKFVLYSDDYMSQSSEWWDDASTAATARDIVVPAATTVSGVNARWGFRREVISTTPPGIRGKLVVGRTLRVSRGSWKPPAVQLSFVWLANGRRVGAGPQLDLTRRFLGDRIAVKVTAVAPGYERVKLTVRASGRVRAAS